MIDQVKFLLGEADLPRTWYNLAADLPGEPAGQPVPPDLPAPLADQEAGTDREFGIPEPVRQHYAQWRPSPLFRARRFELAIDTPARVYYKYEGVAPSGSHHLNTALAQAFYHALAGRRGVVAATGSGRWGSAAAMAAAFFGLTATVYLVRSSLRQKPHIAAMMAAYGADCVPSPSTETAAGLAVLERDPHSPGDIAIATAEALESAADPTLGHLHGVAGTAALAHQTVIGQEAMRQLELAGDYPNLIVGSGSDVAGLAFPFLGAQLRGTGPRVRVIAAESADLAGPAEVTGPAGSESSHRTAPLVRRAVEHGLVEPVTVPPAGCLDAGALFARAEGILPAPESTHVVRVVMREALRCRAEDRTRTILFTLSGHGHFDLAAYGTHLAATRCGGSTRRGAARRSGRLAELART